MGVQITFNFDSWIQLFTEFTYLSPQQGALYFGLAETVHRNDGGGPVTDATTQTNLLYLATAHVAKLLAPPPSGGNAPGRDTSVVGRVTNASEGSVSVATEMPMNPNSAWWQTTQYGSMYWQMSQVFRTMRYIPGAPKPNNPWPIFGTGWGPGGWWGNW
jgi:hypothetical protein